ncbi:MAG: zf-TFIIB domain-containing protein [Planctomycetota bacterium]
MVTQSTMVLSCQKCGGTTNSVAGQEYYHCQYCQSLLLLPNVSPDRITPTGTLLDGTCPVCSQAMQTGLIENQRILYCTNCHGILLRHTDFGTIIAERLARRVGIDPAEPRPIPEGAETRRVDCPACQSVMDAHPYYGPGQVMIDTCTDCGFVWLDQGELKRIEEASWTCAADPTAWTRNLRRDEPRQLDITPSTTRQDDPGVHWLHDLANLLFAMT